MTELWKDAEIYEGTERGKETCECCDKLLVEMCNRCGEHDCDGNCKPIDIPINNLIGYEYLGDCNISHDGWDYDVI